MKRFRIRHFFKALAFLIKDKFSLTNVNYKLNPKTLLVVKLDAIGDYLLFRNFLNDIKQSKKFKQYQITLCGNILWKELAETLDASSIDTFIWIDKKKFLNDGAYRRLTLRQIKQKGFEVSFQPTFSREVLTGDSVIEASGAIERIGSGGDDANEISLLKYFSDGYYTKLFSNNSSVDFEFEKNKLIVEELIEENIERVQPILDYTNNNEEGKLYAILFPGAGEVQKKWPLERFALIADMLKREYNLEIRICGAQSDFELGEKIISYCETADPINLCGKTNLLALVDQISSSRFLFTNDSSALHIAACLNIKTVCVLNGRHFGRFAPYPENMTTSLAFVFPDEMDRLLQNDKDIVVSKTKHNAIASIDSISVTKVEQALREMNL